MRFERYDRIGGHYASMWPLIVPGYVPILNAMLDVTRALPTQPHQILDLGCGPGSATAAVSQACDPAGSVTLSDGSPAMLESARHILGAHVHEAILGDFTEPDTAAAVFQPSRYDLALVSFALHHLEDEAKVATLRRVGESVREGGLLLLADEVAVDVPGGWQVVEQIRNRLIREHLDAGRVTQAFWQLEISLPPELAMPFLPARVEDLTSWLAGVGFAVACPVLLFGSALLVGLKSPRGPATQ